MFRTFRRLSISTPHRSSRRKLLLARTVFHGRPSTSPVLPVAHAGEGDGGGAASDAVGGGGRCIAEVAITHPWPEWAELMERLLQKGYLRQPDGLRRAPSSNHIRTASLNFARERSDIIRYLSRKNIHMMIGSGCPTIDRKVVNSGKRLRSLVGVDEAHVCKSCNLRGSCERAYVKVCQDEGGRTVDVMRILLTYGLEFMTGTIDSELLLNKNVMESSRKLLREVLEFSARKPNLDCPETTSRSHFPLSPESSRKHVIKGESHTLTNHEDWVCPKCKFVNFAKNIKCLRCGEMSQEKLKRLRAEREHLPLKKGDWLCETCNFLNFAKNSRCLQCNEKPAERQLNQGEWECTSCNYINFRRNVACLRCNWKRPRAALADANFAYFQPDSCDNRASLMTLSHKNSCYFDFRNTKQRDNSLNWDENFFWSSRDDEFDSDENGRLTDFEDFPIAGGKGLISQDPLEKQKWIERKRNKERSRSGIGCTANDVSAHVKKSSEDNLCMASDNFRHLELEGVSDDEELSGWFGHRSKKLES